MAKYKKHVEVVPVDYKYSFGNQSDAKRTEIRYRNTFSLGIDRRHSMSETIKIWLVGNTGLRNPNRIQEGFAAYAGSPSSEIYEKKRSCLHEFFK